LIGELFFQVYLPIGIKFEVLHRYSKIVDSIRTEGLVIDKKNYE
jgi:hypothetical protein